MNISSIFGRARSHRLGIVGGDWRRAGIVAVRRCRDAQVTDSDDSRQPFCITCATHGYRVGLDAVKKAQRNRAIIHFLIDLPSFLATESTAALKRPVRSP